MTNEAEYSPCRYNGNGTTKNFPFTWKIFRHEDIIVTLENISTEQQTTLEYGIDYNLTFSDVGGEVLFVSAPTADYKVIISRDVSEYQSTKYSTSPGFQSSEIEKSFDKVSCEIQEAYYTLDRAVKVKLGSPNLNLTMPEPDRLKTIVWNSDGTGLANSDIRIDELGGIVQECRDKASSAQTSANNAQQSATNAENAKNSILNNQGFIKVSNDLLGDNKIGAVADNISDINTIEDNINTIKSVNNNQANINSAVANSQNINSVVANEGNINAVNANKANINTVASNISKVTTVANNNTNINTIANNMDLINQAFSNTNQLNENTSDIADIANTVSSLIEKVIEDTNELNSLIQSEKEILDEKIDTEAETLDTKIDAEVATLTNKINTDVSNLNTAINLVLNKLIKQVNENTSDIADLANTISSLVEAIGETNN